MGSETSSIHLVVPGRVSHTARDSVVEAAPRFAKERISSLRDTLNLSQAVFAQALNVSPETVRAWEQGKRQPDGAALRLLQLATDHPQWILQNVRTAADDQPAGSYKVRETRGQNDG